MREVKHQIVDSPESLASCVDKLAKHDRFGFDTEFVGEETYHPHLCLIQVATDDHLYLIDPFDAGPLESFWQLLLDPNREVVTHAGREEIRMCKLFIGKPPANLFDLQIAAGFIGLPYPLGHGSLINQLLGVKLSKGETRTEWRNRPLTRDQVHYALDDVRYVLPAHKKLSERLARLQRTEWVREECQRLVANSVRDPESGPVVERWRKLRGIGTLDSRRLALVRALYAWREQRAETYNRPARTILRDDLLVEVARRNPKKAADLQVVRGLAKRELDAIFAVIDKARSLPVEEHPEVAEREPDQPHVTWITNVLLGLLGDWALRNELAANVIASASELRALVKARLGGDGEASLLNQGWRAQHVLPLLRNFLDGKLALHVADPTSETPFQVTQRRSRQKHE